MSYQGAEHRQTVCQRLQAGLVVVTLIMLAASPAMANDLPLIDVSQVDGLQVSSLQTDIIQPDPAQTLSKQAQSSKADFVLIKKAERKLYLYSGEEVIKTYPIWLGKNPKGHKQREGDNRTPEGRYMIDWRNPFSKYFLSLHVSYPSQQDIQRARQKGVSPGGSIMIHGLPNEPKKPIDYYKSNDWTFGCVAVLNQHMGEIWRMVEDNTPIEILP